MDKPTRFSGPQEPNSDWLDVQANRVKPATHAAPYVANPQNTGQSQAMNIAGITHSPRRRREMSLKPSRRPILAITEATAGEYDSSVDISIGKATVANVGHRTNCLSQIETEVVAMSADMNTRMPRRAWRADCISQDQWFRLVGIATSSVRNGLITIPIFRSALYARRPDFFHMPVVVVSKRGPTVH